MSNRFKIAISLLAAVPSLYGMNLLRPYEILLAPEHTSTKRFEIALWSETGIGTECYGNHSHHHNPLTIWNDSQSMLAMIKGMPSNSVITYLDELISAEDDGVRGHVRPDASLKLLFSGALGLRFFWGKGWSLSAYLPYMSMKLSDVCLQDLTKSDTPEDIRVKQYLTRDIRETLLVLGGIDTNGWKRTGLGDLIVLLAWYRNFYQAKPFLKNVRVHWHIGLGFPTGLKEDIDKLFAIPFGFDGSFFIPYCIGLDLYFAACIKAGVEAELFQVFGHTRCRRIKTDPSQTDLFLLHKTPVYCDHALVQRFSVYLESYHFPKGMSVRVGYQFYKRGENKYSISNNAFSPNIANTAESIFDWTVHSIFLNASYDFGALLGYSAPVIPKIALFMRLPFNGLRSVAFRTIGATVSFDF